MSDYMREQITRAIHTATCEESLRDCLDPDWPGPCMKSAAGVLPIVREAQAEALRDAAQAIEDSDKALPDLAIATAIRSLRFRADDMIEGDR